MCRLVAWVADRPRSLSQVLGEAGLARLRHLATVHADGWGAAWHDDDEALVTQRSGASASADEAFSAFSEQVASRVGLVHLRLGTPGYGYGPTSSHPFVEGPWAFAHNGAILPGERIDALLSADSSRRPVGPTDSERVFLAVREEMQVRSASVPDAVAAVAGRLDSAGLTTSSLNSLLLGPTDLHVICRHDAGWQPSDIPVWPVDLPQPVPAYFPMSWREEDQILTVVSSGIVERTPAWRDLPNNTVLTVALGSRESTLSPWSSPSALRA